MPDFGARQVVDTLWIFRLSPGFIIREFGDLFVGDNSTTDSYAQAFRTVLASFSPTCFVVLTPVLASFSAQSPVFINKVVYLKKG